METSRCAGSGPGGLFAGPTWPPLLTRDCAVCDRKKDGSGNEVAELLLEAVQDARLGLAHGGGGDPQVGGDLVGRTALQDHAAKGLPGALLKLGADQLDGPAV